MSEITEATCHRVWYALRTHPRKELVVTSLLEGQDDIDVYLPEVLQRRGGQVRLTPLFPGYLFVGSIAERLSIRELNRTPGVVNLVSFGGEPHAVPDQIIVALKVRVDRMNTEGGLPTHSFRPGDAMRMSDGPLAGLEVIFVRAMRRSDRVAVLIEFLGRQQEIVVDVAALEAVDPRPSVAFRPRRTRGGGRRIRNSPSRGK